jgi:predicted RNase H-like HicB family nuclease
MSYYIALIHKEATSDFGVSFPDFPGCVTAGSTLDEAFDMAIEALAGHIDAMIDGGEAIPPPSSMEEVMANPENRDGVAVLVPAPEPADRTMRLSVTLPESLVRRIDAVSRNRSRFLAEAAEQKLSR